MKYKWLRTLCYHANFDFKSSCQYYFPKSKDDKKECIKYTQKVNIFWLSPLLHNLHDFRSFLK